MGTLFPTLVYLLCFATSTACAFLLARSFRKSRSRMLFWSALCFALLALVNLAVIFDLVIYPDDIDLRPLRLWLTLLAVGVLLFGFIWDGDS
jgi:drug/metabolite transporter (DMT)-like permease